MANIDRLTLQVRTWSRPKPPTAPFSWPPLPPSGTTPVITDTWDHLVPSLAAFYPGVPKHVVQQLREAAIEQLIAEHQSGAVQPPEAWGTHIGRPPSG